jgi:hypothetical protein
MASSTAPAPSLPRSLLRAGLASRLGIAAAALAGLWAAVLWALA